MECAPSASMAAEPTVTPPTSLASAIRAFAASAIRTVRLSPCIPRPCPYDALAMLIAGNWKMFRGPEPSGLAGIDAVVCPPFTRLRDCVVAGLTTYAQNVHWEPEGAY